MADEITVLFTVLIAIIRPAFTYPPVKMPSFKENALLLQTCLDGPVPSGFDQIYAGDEFCQRLLPDGKTIAGLAERCFRANAGLTLVTPYLTGDGIDRLKSLLGHIVLNSISCELVINDWGVLELLEDYPARFRIIAGRLLIARYLSKFHYQDSGVPAPGEPDEDFFYFFPRDFINFLKDKGIVALEFNNPGHLFKTSSQLKENNLKAHIYLPYYYLNTSRYCSCARGYGSYMQNADDPCDKECDRFTAVRRDDYLNTELLSRGNTLFIKEKKRIDDLALDTDRVIYNDKV